MPMVTRWKLVIPECQNWYVTDGGGAQLVYGQVLDRVLRDFSDKVSRAEVTLSFREPDVIDYQFGSSSSAGLLVTSDIEAVAVEVASQLQADLFTRDYIADWPPCGQHPHPAKPVLHDGEAVWMCPLTGAVVGRVGRLV